MTVSVLANIDVDDLAQAIDFYCSALELTVGRRFGGFAVKLLGASAAIYLLRIKAPARSPRRFLRGGVNTLGTGRRCIWTSLFRKIEPAVARAQSAGVRLESEVRTERWGRIAAMADPFGHGFCLIEFLGRGDHEIAT